MDMRVRGDFLFIDVEANIMGSVGIEQAAKTLFGKKSGLKWVTPFTIRVEPERKPKVDQVGD